MTIFGHAYLVGGALAMAAAWLQGGHAERRGTLILLLNWVLCMLLADLRIGHLRAGIMVVDLLTVAAFVRLALEEGRWWLLGISGSGILWLFVHALTIGAPDLSLMGLMSAQLGFGLLAVVFLGLGPMERWLAGEQPVSSTRRWLSRRSTT